MYSYSANSTRGMSGETLDNWERALFKAIAKFNTKTKYLTFTGISTSGVRDGFNNDVNSDIIAVGYSMILVCTYCILNMGGWSPIHFRSLGALVTLICVGLSYGSSNGLAFLLGF